MDARHILMLTRALAFTLLQQYDGMSSAAFTQVPAVPKPHWGTTKHENHIPHFRPSRERSFRSAQSGVAVFSLAIKRCTQYEKDRPKHS